MTTRARWLIGVWVIALAVLTAGRVVVWGDELTLWRAAATAAPGKLRPQVQLGTLLHQQGRLEDAERHYVTALALWARGRPVHERVGCQAARWNYVVLLQQRGDWRAAADWSSYPCE